MTTADQPTSVRPDRQFTIGGDSKQSPKLGAFLGVFTPTLLTILGAIMYLRFGWVVGNVGLLVALSIVVLANSITFITTLSFSAIATNTRVGVGGAYFIISRSLGLELGGAIGLPLFLSQVFSVTLYAFALAESFRHVLPWLPLDVTAFVIILGVGVLSNKGADVALRAQIPIMVLVGLSMVALAIGALTGSPVVAPEGAPELGPPEGYWAVFAVFFPAVTGVMAGLGLSGDLEDPRSSIPKGSITATLAGFAVYVCIVILLAIGADSYMLREEEMIWTKIAFGGPFFVLLGMWGAIFSSAVGSILGAPRTLQALINDHASPHSFLGKLAASRDGGEPIAGLVFSVILALGAVLLGDLNTVAQVVTMFYLTVYGAVNLVAALETLSGDASWRPKLRVPWVLSLAAGLACIAVMFLINPLASLAAIAIQLALWFGFQRLERRADWGDMRRDIYEALIRWALVRLRTRPTTARNWRPHILVFADDVARRLDLVRFANWFSQDRGVVTVCELVEGDVLDDPIDLPARHEVMNKVLDENGLVVFGEVDVVHRIDRGIVDVVQANGIAGLDSNTVMLGWPNADNLIQFLGVMKRLEKLNKSVIIGRPRASAPAREGRRRAIHVWWGGLERNGDMMLLLAHLLTRNPEWRGADIQVSSVASNESTRSDTEGLLKALLPEARIDARTRVLVKPKDKSIRDVIHEESARADVVFLGLATPAPGEEAAYAQRLADLSEGLGTVFFVKNASPFVGKLAL